MHEASLPSPFPPALGVGVVAAVAVAVAALALRSPDPGPLPQPVLTPVRPESAAPPTSVTPPVAERPQPAVRPERARPLLDQYWNYSLAGTKTAYARVLAVPAVRDGAPCVELREEYYERTHSKIAEKTREESSELLAFLEPEFPFGILEMTFTQREQERTRVIRVTRDAQGYVVEDALENGKRVKRFDGVGTVSGSWDLLLMQLARDGKLAPGTRTEFQEFDLFAPQVVKKTVETKSARGGEYEVAFDVVQATLDARGVIRKGRIGGTEVTACTAEEAREFGGEEVVTLRDDLNIDFTFPRYGALDEVELRIEVHDDTMGDIFANTEYQSAEFHQEGSVGVYRLVMKPYRFAEAEALAASEPACDLAEFLESTPMEQCDDPLIQAKAREIVGDRTDPLEQVRAISTWINVNLRKEYTDIGGLTAVETLRRMGGDCSEHATLFNALARARGIPVRECSGFVFLGEVGGRHSWSQVHIDGRWLHVDTVIDTVGADPRYILFYKHRPGHERDLTYGRRMTHLTTHPARASVTSFTVFGRRWEPEQAMYCAGVREGKYDNPILGLSFPLPNGWRGAMQTFPLQYAQFRRDGAQLDVRVVPYRLEMVKQYPWMLGMMGGSIEWAEVPAGKRTAQRATGGRRGKSPVAWAVEFEDGTLVFQLDGGGKDPARDVADIEAMLAGMTLLEPGAR